MSTTVRPVAVSAWIITLIFTIVSLTTIGAPSTGISRLAVPRNTTELTEMLSSIETLGTLASLAALTLTGWLLLTTAACVALSVSGNLGIPASRLFRTLSTRGPGFMVALVTSSVISTTAAHGSTPTTGGPGSSGPEASRNPTMELVSPTPGVATHMPWAEQPDLSAAASATPAPSTPATSARPATSPPAPASTPFGPTSVAVQPDTPLTTTDTGQSTHLVLPGEHLWSIAQDTVQQRIGEDAPLSRISSYWRILVEENRDRLADPSNPDFILPGQVLKLPA